MLSPPGWRTLLSAARDFASVKTDEDCWARRSVRVPDVVADGKPPAGSLTVLCGHLCGRPGESRAAHTCAHAPAQHVEPNDFNPLARMHTVHTGGCKAPSSLPIEGEAQSR